jgi:hypothetical protein
MSEVAFAEDHTDKESTDRKRKPGLMSYGAEPITTASAANKKISFDLIAKAK